MRLILTCLWHNNKNVEIWQDDNDSCYNDEGAEWCNSYKWQVAWSEKTTCNITSLSIERLVWDNGKKSLFRERGKSTSKAL